jgi:hypothetical protein
MTGSEPDGFTAKAEIVYIARIRVTKYDFILVFSRWWDKGNDFFVSNNARHLKFLIG